jgi:hypothetical protein
VGPTEGSLVAVADAGPLIHLDELGIRRGQRTRSQVIDLLQQIPVRSTLHIRPTLLREIVEEVERS